jgi:thiol-disulfide isomerase/thioredoxin
MLMQTERKKRRKFGGWRLILIPLLLPILTMWCTCSTKNLLNPTEKSGSIWVSSNPSGGDILLDHVVTGLLTPDTLKAVPVGEHVITVTKEGFITAPDSVSISVEENGFDSVRFDLLEPTKGTLKVTSDPEGAIICIDHQPQTETTPFVFFNSIPVGPHTISVFKEGYANDNPVKETVDIVTQDTAEVYFSLTPAEVGDAVGNITPDFELEDDYHFWYQLYAYRGGVCLINFWSKSCTNCMKELPYLQQIYNDYLADSLVIFGINDGGSQGDEGFDIIQQVREQKQLTFILLKGLETDVKSDYGISLTPVTIILDRSGRVYYYMVGFTSGWEVYLRQKLDELFGK